MCFAVSSDVPLCMDVHLAYREHSFGKIAQVVIDESKDGYPELEERKDFILKVLTRKRREFAKTIDQGLGIPCRYGRAYEG